jgi:hypothetical protein
MAEENPERRIIDAWMKQYLDRTMEHPEDDLRTVVKGCHFTHFQAIGMQDILARFVGRIDLFIDFLENDWKWKIDYDAAGGTIIANEDKDFCVCPLVKTGLVTSKELCACSEGFAEKMFSQVLGKEVRAEVIRSYLRDGKSCVYRIAIPGGA